MGNLRGNEWLILILLVVLLFGARRLPDAARGLGRSLRIFKAETKGLAEDSTTSTDTQAVEAAKDSTTSATETAVETPAPESGKPTQS